MTNDIVAALEPVVDALTELGVRYRVGGSVASSAFGVPRSTLDVDVACELREEHVGRFVARLSETYYIDADMITDAIRRAELPGPGRAKGEPRCLGTRILRSPPEMVPAM